VKLLADNHISFNGNDKRQKHQNSIDTKTIIVLKKKHLNRDH